MYVKATLLSSHRKQWARRLQVHAMRCHLYKATIQVPFLKWVLQDLYKWTHSYSLFLNNYSTTTFVYSSKVETNLSINQISLFGNANSNAVVGWYLFLHVNACYQGLYILAGLWKTKCTSFGKIRKDKCNWLVQLSILRLLAKSAKG